MEINRFSCEIERNKKCDLQMDYTISYYLNVLTKEWERILNNNEKYNSFKRIIEILDSVENE